MRNLTILFFSITLLSLAFVGCQTSDDLTSPVDLDKKQPIVIPIAVNGENAGVLTEVDLIAGGTTICGHITVQQVDESRYLELYYYAAEGWKIMETHAGAGAYPSYLPVDETTGYPLMGYFEHNEFYENGVSVAGPIYLTIPLTQALKSMVYIGAHAIVKECDNGEGTEVYCPDLSAYVKYSSTGPFYHPGEDPPYGFGDIIFWDATGTSQLANYPTFCIDLDRTINKTDKLNARFICTYGSPLPEDILCIIEYPDNLDVLNYFINNYAVGDLYNGGIIQADEYQAIIWKLLEDRAVPINSNFSPNMTLVNALVADLLIAGEGFVPGCDDKIAILLVR